MTACPCWALDYSAVGPPAATQSFGLVACRANGVPVARPPPAAASRPAPQDLQQGQGRSALPTEQQAVSSSDSAAAPVSEAAAQEPAATGSALSAARALAARIAQAQQGPPVSTPPPLSLQSLPSLVHSEDVPG